MKNLVYALLFITVPIFCTAQSIFQAGQIKVEYIGGSTSFVLKVNVELIATVTTNPPDAVNVCWGDGLCEDITLASNTITGNKSLLNYQGFHTFPAEGTYVISTSPCCFVQTSSNITESYTKDFPLEVEYTFSNPQFIGINNIAMPQQPLIDLGTNAGDYHYSPAVFDLDGDSIIYELVPIDVDGFQYPDEITPFSIMLVDSLSGTIVWTNPAVGYWHVALKMKEYRFGTQLSANTLILQLEIQPVTSATDLEATEIMVFPNPAYDQLFINSLQEELADIRLINASGQIVYQQSNVNLSNWKIPIQELSNGSYTLQFFNNQRQLSKKVIIFNQ